MVDSRSSSLYRGMRNHPPASVGEAMSQVQSGSCHGEGEGPIPRAKRERGLRRVRESPGFPEGDSANLHRERKRESVRKSKAKKQRRDQKFVDCEICGAQAPKEWECQVLSALLGGSERSMASTATFCSEKGERTLRTNAGGFQQGRIGSVAKNARRRISVLSSESTTNGRGKDYARNAGRSRRERQL